MYQNNIRFFVESVNDFIKLFRDDFKGICKSINDLASEQKLNYDNQMLDEKTYKS